MRALLLAGVVAVGWVGGAHAGVIEYTSQAAFNAAAPGLAVQTFSGYPVGVDLADAPSAASPYTYGPLTFTTSAGTYLYLANDREYGSSVQYLAAVDGQAVPSLSVTPPAGTTAIAFELGTYFGAATVDVSVDGVTQASLSTSGGAPTTTFLGLTDTAPITSLSLSLVAGIELDFTAFQVGAATTTTAPPTFVPEPASMALLGVGALGMLAAVGRRRGVGAV